MHLQLEFMKELKNYKTRYSQGRMHISQTFKINEKLLNVGVVLVQ